jgi:hypothetical protein
MWFSIIDPFLFDYLVITMMLFLDISQRIRKIHSQTAHIYSKIHPSRCLKIDIHQNLSLID